MSHLYACLRALNDAAYAAIRAGADTTEYPDLNRALLRTIARASDELVDSRGATPLILDRREPGE